MTEPTQPTTAAGPRTPTGRRIDRLFREAYERGDQSASWQDAREWVLAIEAEARGQDGSALRRLYEAARKTFASAREDSDLYEALAEAHRALAALPPSAPPAPQTLTELERLAAPLHARVITREAMETMTRLAYEKGLADARLEQDR